MTVWRFVTAVWTFYSAIAVNTTSQTQSHITSELVRWTITCIYTYTSSSSSLSAPLTQCLLSSTAQFITSRYLACSLSVYTMLHYHRSTFYAVFLADLFRSWYQRAFALSAARLTFCVLSKVWLLFYNLYCTIFLFFPIFVSISSSGYLCCHLTFRIIKYFISNSAHVAFVHVSALLGSICQMWVRMKTSLSL